MINSKDDLNEISAHFRLCMYKLASGIFSHTPLNKKKTNPASPVRQNTQKDPFNVTHHEFKETSLNKLDYYDKKMPGTKFGHISKQTYHSQ